MAIQAQLYPENLGFSFGAAHDLIMDNACGFNQFSLINPQQFMQYEDHFQNLSQSNRNVLQNVDNLLCSMNMNMSNTNHQSIAFPQTLYAHLEKQRLEVDRFVTLQNERLRTSLQERRKQQTIHFLQKYEAKAQFLLKQKQEAITKAMNRKGELEDILKRMENENQAWQRVAKENEEMVLSLNNTIEKLKEQKACVPNHDADDAESCFDVIENRAEMEQENRRQEKMVCRNCSSRNLCMIMLPCMHLCSCKYCEVLFDCCPVCKTVKKASIEALI